MCYVHGSLDQATSVCPMCKVFKPIGGARCPHVKEVCQNRTNHPRHDVVYLKNAEVQTFQGCGFCKWARTNPPLRLTGYQNPGWPGCCRPPRPEEEKLIGAADWRAVSIIHHVAIPLEVRALLDSITAGKGGPMGSMRATNAQSLAPSMVRRASYQVGSPTRGDSNLTKSSSMAIPSRGRSGGSPQQGNLPLSGNATRNSSANTEAHPASLPNRSAMDLYQPPRRSTADQQSSDKRSESTNTSQHSPGHRNVDLSGSISRRNTDRRPSITAVTTSMSVSKVTADITPQKRRLQNPSQHSPPPNPSTARPAERPAERPTERPIGPPPSLQRRGSTLERSLASMNISSASSSSSGSNSETTVISDGGFTDYLSDESEAELQRQAEAKAAMIAQNHAEEQEFRAARQQLASIDLRPPKSWNSNGNSTPRSQTSVHSSSCAPPSSYTFSGSAAVAGSAQSRG